MEPSFHFQTAFKVRIGDINYGGHMGNDKMLLVFHDARIRFLDAFGFSESGIGEGAGLIMSEAHISFKGEVFLGDELNVGVRITDMGKVKFNMDFHVERKSDKRIVAEGSTLMVSFDYKNRKICKIPKEFKENILKTLGKLQGKNT